MPLPVVEEITASEITLALSRVTNQRAAGTDGLHAELLKCGAEYLSPLIANIINTAVETYRNASQAIGVGTMAPLAKPGKPRGPDTSIRPIVLLNTIRKALSIVVLKRITPAVEPHLGPTQSGSRRGYSSADVVWTQMWLSAKAVRHEWKYHMLSIDMSRAFDTTHRRRLMTVRGSRVISDAYALIASPGHQPSGPCRASNHQIIQQYHWHTPGRRAQPWSLYRSPGSRIEGHQPSAPNLPQADVHIPHDTEYWDNVNSYSTRQYLSSQKHSKYGH